MESEVITLQDIFLAKPPDEDTAFSGGTRLLGPLACTGLKPHFLDKMAAHGVALQPNFFDEDQSAGYRANLAVANFGGFS
jgi:pilus assembly protein CpaF